MVFDFLKKKLQSALEKPKPQGPEALYEEKRREAEALHVSGKTADAVRLLEGLASDLAGVGNFPLAVAVRHQIHQWNPDGAQSPETEAARMADQRAAAEKEPAAVAPFAPSESSISRLVNASQFLEQLTKDEITGLIESTGLTTFEKGATVVEEGTSGDKLFIVTRGHFAVSTLGPAGNRIRVGTLSVGDFFGEIALLTGRPRAATVLADSSAECLQITSASWVQLSESHPRLRELLEQAMALRAELTAEAVLDDMRRQREKGEEKGV